MLELDDIQGIVFSGYGKKPFASYLLLEIVDRARAHDWLGMMAERVTTGRDRPEDECLNLAVTSQALERLHVDQETLATFALEFREGMAGSATRSRALGDVEDNAPTDWLWGRPEQRVDILLMLYAASEAQLAELIRAQRVAFHGILECVWEQSTISPENRREHFGFADGIAQPVMQYTGHDTLLSDLIPGRTVKAGEFLLGHENEYDKLPFVPNVAPALDHNNNLSDCQTGGGRRALGHNGSYLVVRQLQQHVFAFWQAMRRAAQLDGSAHGAGDVPEAAVEVAAKCVGRWPGGAPLALSPTHDDPALAEAHDFGFLPEDQAGLRCPVGAHIRRVNPRDSLEPDPRSSIKVVDRHRIMRRGRSYGTQLDRPWLCEADDGEARGLVFIGINANIRRQFEFIQQTWVNNPKFSGLYDELDPLIGSREDTPRTITIPSEPTRRRHTDLPHFVRVRGGDYFFLPSIRALRFLAALSADKRMGDTDESPPSFSRS